MNLDSGLQAELDIQRVIILHKHCQSSIAGIIGAALIIGSVAYAHLQIELFLLWFIGTLSAIPVRAWLRHRLSKTLKNNDLSLSVALNWERKWVISSLLPSLTILSAIFFPYEGNQLTIYLFIALVMVAMVAGSIISSVTSIKTFLVFMNTTIPPFILICLFKGTGHFLTLSAFLITFYIVFLTLALTMNRTVLRAIKLQILQKDMSNKDSLTNLWNRRKLFSVIEPIKELQYCVLMIDVDNFKQLNDKYGHARGDEVLVDLSQSILSVVSNKELVVRYGGEEFLVLIFNQDIEYAKQISEKICAQTINDCDLTVSIGIATTEQSEDFDTVVELADRAMYEAKRQGRNRVQSSRF